MTPLVIENNDIKTFIDKSLLSKDFFLKELAENGLIVLKKAKYDSFFLLDFAKKIGKIRIHDVNGIKNSLPGCKEIMLVGNKKYDENSKGCETTIGTWHTDYAFKLNTDCPTILKCKKTPKNGAYTSYVFTPDLFDSLDENLKDRLRNYKMIFDYTYFYEKYADDKRTPLTNEMKQALKPIEKNLVIKHPISGRECLFICFESGRKIKDVSDKESDFIIKSLFEIVDDYKFSYEHKWDEDDILMWDNRCMLHKGKPYNYNQVRELHRITVESDYSFGNYI
tara:strand:- start:2028 stop:2867 length:840 start_codon:yes stop_codon:yes gene_type:complete